LLAVLILLSASAFAMDAGSGGVAGDGHVGEPSILGYTAGQWRYWGLIWEVIWTLFQKNGLD
jgi:hypothetical protein